MTCVEKVGEVVPLLYHKRKEALAAKLKAYFLSSGEQDRTADLMVMNAMNCFKAETLPMRDVYEKRLRYK